MKFLLLLLAAMLSLSAWLTPVHYRPWVTYTGELLAFISLFVIATLYLKERIQIPKISLGLLLLSFVPVLQWLFGEIYFVSTALLCFCFVFAFWLSTVLGYNLSLTPIDREKTFTQLSLLITFAGTVTAIFAILQWVNVDEKLSWVMDFKGNRPYANFAQPNHMASFLIVALLASLYLFEKQKVKNSILVLSSILMVFAVALSQSRTSWVVCCCILAYGAYQQYKGFIQLKWCWALAWVAFFLGCIFSLPLLNQVMAQVSDLQVVQTTEVAARATGDMSRLAIWQQMLHAIYDRPWLGYGWDQVSVAYTLVSAHFTWPVWVDSAHNFLIDFILWNGILIGLPFLLYFMYWAYRLHQHANSTESVVGLLMVGAIFVHAMLEYPQYYAYFLLLIGFVIGTIQAQNPQTQVVILSPRYMQVTYVLALPLLILIIRDYDVASDRLNEAIRYEKTPEKIKNHQPIYLLTEFEQRIDWTLMSPYTVVNQNQIDDLYGIILNYPTRYNLLKFAKLLAFNQHESEAKEILFLLKQTNKMQRSYQSLLDEQPHKP